MLDTDSSRASRALTAAWLAFASINLVLMFALPGEETIPYHLIWASFALLYGLIRYTKAVTWLAFWTITVATGVPMVRHAIDRVIGWEECTEIVLMGVLVALLIWHVDRQRSAQDRLTFQIELEARRNRNREITAQFGSHEVRTRLTIARGFVELIRAASPEDSMRADADVVLAELDKASGLATKLLTLVRVEGPPHRTPMDMDLHVELVMRRWQPTAVRRWSCASNVGVMVGDAERIEAALDCLIENALKFTTETDSIAVRAWREDDTILISVADTGTGIPADELDRVTEVFQTGSMAGERAGSGIGLAIVRAVAESRRGSLEVTGDEGVGTRFTMRFPTLPTGPEIEPPLAVPPEVAGPSLTSRPTEPAQLA